ncbi:MAG: tetratricopeptide repeat protein [Bacteroidota bacterium]
MKEKQLFVLNVICSLCLVGLLAACGSTGAATTPPAATDGADEPVPIYEAALGTFNRSVTTNSPVAQQYVNQGFQMMYAFASGEAPATFREAQTHDDACAMCFWGEAWSLGPYLNGKMRGENAPAAYKAIQQAKTLAADAASPVEHALIDAMLIRYAPEHDDEDRTDRDTLYAAALAEAYAEYPGDTDIGTLYAESLMLLEPRRGRWSIDDPDVQAIHQVLEEVLARDIKHPGACHLYIHATESTTKPGKAEACAEYLGDAIPGASHINHMPSHTYNRIGRWGDAVRANIQAWHSDLKAEIDEGFAIYPSHNLHMLLFAASMDGQGGLANQAARDYSKIIDGGNFYEALTLLRFGRFDELLALECRPKREIFRGLWDFSKGYAHLRTGNLKKARQHLARVEKTARETPADKTFRGHSAAELLGVTGGILKAEILVVQGQAAQAVAVYEQALALEDSLRYDEPEPLNFSARHWLGALYLDMGQPADAEAVYRAALEDHPNNGWSLLGLAQALEAQSDPEADKVYEAFKLAWARADTWIRSSRF